MSRIREKRNKEGGVEKLNSMKLGDIYYLTLYTYITSLNHFIFILSVKKRNILKSQPKHY